MAKIRVFMKKKKIALKVDFIELNKLQVARQYLFPTF